MKVLFSPCCDDGGHVTKTIDALDRETDQAYDAMNRLTQVTSPSGSNNTMTYSYDILGRMTASTDFNGKTTYREYDYRGLVTRVADENDATLVQYGYSASEGFGRISRVVDGAGHETLYDYDATTLRPTYVKNAVNEYTRFYYDTHGRLTRTAAGVAGTTDPVDRFYDDTTGLLTKLQYTNAGNVKTIDYHYDALGRQVQVDDWMHDPGHTSSHYFEYNEAGRMTRYRDFDDDPAGTRHTLNYTYDAAGRVVTMLDYDGNATTYTYTDTGQLSTLTTPGEDSTTKTWDFDYNALGQRTHVSAPNGTTCVYAYDTLNRLTSIQYKDNNDNILDSWTYGLSNTGDVLDVINADNSFWMYQYDDRHRLTTASRCARLLGPITAGYQYTYDAADNLVTKVEPFKDNFNDGSLAGWTQYPASTWDASNHYLTKTSYGWSEIYRSNADADFDLWFSYCKKDAVNGNWLDVIVRFVDWNNYIELVIYGNQMQLNQVSGGTPSNLETVSVTSSLDEWYDVFLRCDGASVTVSRAD